MTVSLRDINESTVAFTYEGDQPSFIQFKTPEEAAKFIEATIGKASRFGAYYACLALDWDNFNFHEVDSADDMVATLGLSDPVAPVRRSNTSLKAGV